MAERIKNFLIGNRKKEIEELANDLEVDYSIIENLGITGRSAELFNLYFRGYLTAQTLQQSSDFLRQPQVEILRKVPILREMVGIIDQVEKNRQEVTRNYFNEASELNNQMTDVGSNLKTSIRIAANLISSTYSKEYKTDEEFWSSMERAVEIQKKKLLLFS